MNENLKIIQRKYPTLGFVKTIERTYKTRCDYMNRHVDGKTMLVTATSIGATTISRRYDA